MVEAFVVDLSTKYVFAKYDFPQDLEENFKNLSNAISETYNGMVKNFAEMHPLWMQREYKGMKYYGGNPHNMYPSERYATSDMYDRIIPERNNITAIAFGAYNFSVEDVSTAYVGKEKINEINMVINSPQRQI